MGNMHKITSVFGGENAPSGASMTHRCESQREAAMPTPLLTPKTTTLLGTWNVRNIQIRRRKWGWIGHTLRKTNCNVIKQALRWNPKGKRSRGRPRNSWRRTVDDEASKAGYTWWQLERIAQNRPRWRAMVSVDLCSTGSERV